MNIEKTIMMMMSQYTEESVREGRHSCVVSSSIVIELKSLTCVRRSRGEVVEVEKTVEVDGVETRQMKPYRYFGG